MKIAVVVSGFPVISETFITNHVVGLVKAGHDVRVLMRRPSRENFAATELEGVSLLPLRRSATLVGKKGSFVWFLSFVFKTIRAFVEYPRKSIHVLAQIVSHRGDGLSSNPFAAWAMVVPLFSRWKPDIIHCHFGNSGIFWEKIIDLGIFNAPLVVSFHGYDVHKAPRKRGRDMYHSLFRTVTAVTANTNFTAECVRRLGCSKSKIHVIPMGFFLNQYKPKNWLPPSSGAPFRILTVARLVEKKGVEYGILAVRELIERGMDIRYDVVGDGELRQYLEGVVTRHGIEPFVTFWGWRNAVEVADHMRESHLFVLPSVTSKDGDMEGQGLVLQEAQAIGLPVVSTLHNGIPEGVQQGRTGVLVPERDVDALAEAIHSLCTDTDTTSLMSHNAKAFVADRYDQDKLTTNWEKLYREING